MADELINPFVGGEVGRQDKASSIPSDMDARDNFRRENLPEILESLTTTENLAAPDASAQAVMDGDAGTYDMSALADLGLVVDDYEGRKTKASTRGITQSGSGPALITTNAAADQANISLHGEVDQQIDVGTLAGGTVIAAAIQAAVRALGEADAENAEAYDGFLAEYVVPTFETTLSLQLDNGVKVFELKLASIAGLKKGEVLEVADQAGGPAAVFDVTVIDIQRFTKVITVQGITPGEDIEVGALVRRRDDFYKFTSGKGGLDSSIVWAAGAADMAAALKMTAVTGAVEGIGSDAFGVQTFRFVTADFANDAAATAAEMAAALNKSLMGAIASDVAGTLRLTSRKFGESANILAQSGVSQAALGLSATVIEQGTQVDVIMSAKNPTILEIQAISAAGVPGDYKTDLSIVRVEGDKLVNVDDTDFSGDDIWRVTHSPRRA